jgi:chemotaxis receptor (MCP) glutamine deamidase CheD
LEEGTVMLQPDVREYFPDSEAVNTALRSLITLMAHMPSKSKSLTQKARGGSSKIEHNQPLGASDVNMHERLTSAP